MVAAGHNNQHFEVMFCHESLDNLSNFWIPGQPIGIVHVFLIEKVLGYHEGIQEKMAVLPIVFVVVDHFDDHVPAYPMF
jgi:hypothetical protein